MHQTLIAVSTKFHFAKLIKEYHLKFTVSIGQKNCLNQCIEPLTLTRNFVSQNFAKKGRQPYLL